MVFGPRDFSRLLEWPSRHFIMKSGFLVSCCFLGGAFMCVPGKVIGASFRECSL